MNFLVDAQLPPAFCRWLRERGHRADHVGDVGLLAESDVNIADYAERERLVLVSKDEDFIFLRLPDRFALLWLRCGNATNAALLTWIAPRWDCVVSLLEGGERLVEVR